jgi:hypothetical protein
MFEHDAVLRESITHKIATLNESLNESMNSIN